MTCIVHCPWGIFKKCGKGAQLSKLIFSQMGQHATRGCAILGSDFPVEVLLLGYRKIWEEIWSLYLHVVLCLIRAGIILEVEN